MARSSLPESRRSAGEGTQPRGAPTLQAIGDDTLEQAAAVIRCLGHPLRLRLLEAMEAGGRTVSQLQRHTGAHQSAVSQQLGVLRGHGVVEGRREGSFVRYRIIESKVGAILNCVRACEMGR